MKKLLLTATFIGSICLANAQTHTNVGNNSGNGVSTDNSSHFGANAGENSVGVENTFIGYLTAPNNTGTRNTLIGARAGQDNTSGQKNTAVGWAAGRRNTTGQGNTSLGDSSLYVNKTGNFNVAVGVQAGYLNTSGSSNVSVGTWAGNKNISGIDNTMIGTMAGFNNLGSRNVFIGHDAGKQELGDDKLYIDNSDISTPLIYGDFDADELSINGKLAIGTMTFDPNSALTVNGKILCEEVEVIQNVAPDYVFQKYYLGESTLKESYTMPTLEEVEAFTKANHHLPEIPSAKEIKEDGMGLKQISTLLLQKVEELTLYTIEQEKRIKTLEAKLTEK